MIFLAVTSQTWFITVLGFGLVLVLLCVFVYIMKLLGYIMQPRQKAVPATKADDQTKAAIATTIAMAQENDDMVAVAYALHLYYNAHDVEPPHITVSPHHSMWNNNL